MDILNENLRLFIMSDPFTVIAFYYDEVMEKVDYEEWARYIRSLFQMAPLKPIRKVLDLAMGTGTLSILMQKMGFDVYGLDFSTGMLKVAQSKFKKTGYVPSLVKADFRDIPFKNSSFEGVFSTFDSLNNILDPLELERVFREVRRILKKGGAFVFDLNTEWSLKEEWDNKTRVEETTNTISIWKSRYINGISYLYFTLLVRESANSDLYKKVFTVFRERGYDPPEVRKLLKKSGFTKVFCFDHFTLNPGKSKNSRVTYLAF
ncbi:MAG: methyltransferase domain-containing protein [candidate division WOR-3 bacterium]